MKKILITGGSGFIALHCVQQALDQGYKVITTVRSKKKENEVLAAMRKYAKSTDNLEIVYADLCKDDDWDIISKDCACILHVASPFFLEDPKHENEVIVPAVEGTLRVLNSALANRVKKVIVTSSVVAISLGHSKSKILFDESDWTNLNSKLTAYAKSKTIAEKKAWDFVNNLPETKKIVLTSINPAAVTGPMLSDDIGTSNNLICQMANGEFPACPKVHVGFVDVRDVAKAHITAISDSKTDRQRIILSSAEKNMVDIGKILYNLGYSKAPIKVMPNFLVKIASIFKKELAGIIPLLGGLNNLSKKQMKKYFKWNFITVEQSIQDTASQLKEMGKIPASKGDVDIDKKAA